MWNQRPTLHCRAKMQSKGKVQVKKKNVTEINKGNGKMKQEFRKQMRAVTSGQEGQVMVKSKKEEEERRREKKREREKERKRDVEKKKEKKRNKIEKEKLKKKRKRKSKRRKDRK